MTPAKIAITVLAAVVAAVFIFGLLRRRRLVVVLRETSQTAFFLLFLFLLTQAIVPLDGYLALSGVLPVDLFTRLSPLLAVSAMLAAEAFIAAMLLSAVTLISAFVAGRVFCGWVCPLGTTFDVFDRLFLSWLDRPQSRDPFLRGLKFLLLAAVLAAALFGTQLAGWFDPMSLATRSYAVSVLPAADHAAKALLEKPLESESFRQDLPRLSSALGRTGSQLKSLNILYDTTYYYVQFALFSGILGGLLFLQVYQKRFWCRKLCPLGAMLGLAGKWRPLGVYLDGGKCIDCGKCREVCPVGAIQGKALSPEECTFCGLCVAPCPVDALSVRPSAPKAVEPSPKVVPGRRGFLLAAASGVAAVPILALNPERVAAGLTVIRPPGAQDEDRFVSACVRCGQCMKACPQNALQPTGFQAGLAGVWTPRIVPAIGYCDYNCLPSDQPVGNFCATVCPTGAIKRLSPSQKHELKLGTAYFRTDKCIPFVERIACGVCVEHCPVPEKALKNEIVKVRDFKTGEIVDLQRPYVDKTLCVGCGECETVCPLKGQKGIWVEPLRTLFGQF
jgi:ferredoxin